MKYFINYLKLTDVQFHSLIVVCIVFLKFQINKLPRLFFLKHRNWLDDTEVDNGGHFDPAQ